MRARYLVGVYLLVGAACASSKSVTDAPDASADVNASRGNGGAAATLGEGGNGGAVAGTGGAGGVSGDQGALVACGQPPSPFAVGGHGGIGYGGAGGTIFCGVGQSYCYREMAVSPGTPSVATCQPVPAGCSTPLTCACVYPWSYVNCRCDDAGGDVFVTCDQV